MAETFAVRTRERLREEILAAASDEVVARGWRGLRMQAVADTVGVSRQTIYNEFTNKQGLARALVLALASAVTGDFNRIVEQSATVHAAFFDTVRHGLRYAEQNEVFRTVMTPDGGDTFLPLYTSDSGPLITLCATVAVTAFSQRWPSLDPERLRIAMEATTRHVLSHIVLPLYPVEQVAEEAASLFSSYLTEGARPASVGSRHEQR